MHMYMYKRICARAAFPIALSNVVHRLHPRSYARELTRVSSCDAYIYIRATLCIHI